MSELTGAPMTIGRAMRAPKTAELIAADMRSRIVRGQLRPGDTLPPEQQLMAQYDVSRPTLREAFRILEAETLISIRRGSRGGAQVMEPDISVAARSVGLILQFNGTTIDDVYAARTISEPACAAMLAERRTEADLSDLQDVVNQLRAVVEAGPRAVPDPRDWSDLTFRFHSLILERCGNRTMALQGAVLQDIVRTHYHLRVALSLDTDESPERFQRVLRAYQRLVDLVRAGESGAAEELWRRHMEVAATYNLGDDLKDKPVVEMFA